MALFNWARKAESPKTASANSKRAEMEAEYINRIYSINAEVNRVMQAIDVGDMQLRDYFFSLIEDQHKANHTVTGIINALCDAIGEMSKYVEIQDNKGKVVQKHWALDLLDSPNTIDTRADLFRKLALSYYSQGEAIMTGMQKAVFSNKSSKYYSLFAIPSHTVDIRSDNLLSPKYFVARSGFTFYGGHLPPMTHENTMHWKRASLSTETLHGVSPLVAVVKQCVIVEKIVTRVDVIVSNGGVVTVVSPMGDPNGYAVMAPKDRQAFIDKVKYNQSPRETAFLDFAAKFDRIGDTPADMDLQSTWERSEQSIANQFMYPLDLLRGNSTYANIEASKKAKYQIALPTFKSMLDNISKFLALTSEGLELVINEDKIEILKPDAKIVLEAMTMAGTTTNERREYLNYPPSTEPQADMIQYSAGTAFMGEDVTLNEDADPEPEQDAETDPEPTP